jgi:purine-binding chemotaxis protein CheW
MTADPNADLARARRILEDRARALALVAEAHEDGEFLDVAVFAIGRERYAIDAASLLAVAPLGAHALIPRAPSYFVGLALYSGQALAVVDLGRLFGFDGAALSDGAQVLVLGDSEGHAELGVVADGVLEVRRLFRRDLAAPPASVSGPGRQAIVGVDPEALILLDPHALLSDRRLFIDEADEGDDHAP